MRHSIQANAQQLRLKNIIIFIFGLCFCAISHSTQLLYSWLERRTSTRGLFDSIGTTGTISFASLCTRLPPILRNVGDKFFGWFAVFLAMWWWYCLVDKSHELHHYAPDESRNPATLVLVLNCMVLFSHFCGVDQRTSSFRCLLVQRCLGGGGRRRQPFNDLCSCRLSKSSFLIVFFFIIHFKIILYFCLLYVAAFLF